jgi:hypothetical protein
MLQRIFALLLALSVCAICARPLQAQPASSTNPDYNKQFYLFASLGALSGAPAGSNITVTPYNSFQFKAFQFGGAAELFVLKGLAVGAELAATPTPIASKPITYTYQTFSGSEATATYRVSGVKGWGVLTLGYHFKGLPVSGRFVPFVTAGTGVFVRDGHTESINYGGGVSLWRSKHRGWRLEYRRHVVGDGGYNTRLRSVRIGLVLRRS